MVIKYTANGINFCYCIMIRQHLKLQEAFPCHLKFIDQDYDHAPLVRQTNGLTNFNNYYEIQNIVTLRLNINWLASYNKKWCKINYCTDSVASKAHGSQLCMA